MVNLTIDGKSVSVPENTTILEAARQVDIHIPTLCWLEKISTTAVYIVETSVKRDTAVVLNTIVLCYENNTGKSSYIRLSLKGQQWNSKHS